VRVLEISTLRTFILIGAYKQAICRGNARSASRIAKIGFDKEGVARDYLKINDAGKIIFLTALVLR